MNVSVCTVSKINYQDVVSSGTLVHDIGDKRPQGWTEQAFNTFEEATEEYMVEVIPESQF